LGKGLAVALTTLAGFFYLAGAILGTLLAAVIGLATTLTGKTSASTASNGVSLVFYLGVASGIAIIAGGAMVFAKPKLRKIGAIVVIAMAIVGAIPTVFGLIIGLALALAGGILALTYKEKKLPQKQIVNADGTVSNSPAVAEQQIN
jgi:hypothetical protein